MKRKGPARDLKKELYWRGILRQQRRSGLTIRGFCRKQGLAEPLFYAWRRELKRRDRPSAGARLRIGRASRPTLARPTFGRRPARSSPSKTVKPRSHGAAFIPIQLSDVAVSPSSEGVECHLPSGTVLRCPPSMEPAAVAALVRAWEQGRC
jgi:hypothetical protein